MDNEEKFLVALQVLAAVAAITCFSLAVYLLLTN